jgi:hypothetical protein
MKEYGEVFAFYFQEPKKEARHWWLMPIILATQEAKIRRIQSGQIVLETLSRKNSSQKKSW